MFQLIKNIVIIILFKFLKLFLLSFCNYIRLTSQITIFNVAQNETLEFNMYFCEFLKQVRLKAGYCSAKTFHQQFTNNDTINLSYSHYTKIEKGQLLPTVDLFLRISNFLNVKNFSEFLACYLLGWANDNKSRNYIKTKLYDQELKLKEHNNHDKDLKINQHILSTNQADEITCSYNNYYLFLKLSLSSTPLSIKELSYNSPLENKTIKNILNKYLKLNIIEHKNSKYQPINRNTRFSKKYKKIVSKYNRETSTENNQALYQRAIYLKSTQHHISSFLSKLSEFEDTFLKYQHNNPKDNSDAYLLNIKLSKRDDLKTITENNIIDRKQFCKTELPKS